MRKSIAITHLPWTWCTVCGSRASRHERGSFDDRPIAVCASTADRQRVLRSISLPIEPCRAIAAQLNLLSLGVWRRNGVSSSPMGPIFIAPSCSLRKTRARSDSRAASMKLQAWSRILQLVVLQIASRWHPCSAWKHRKRPNNPDKPRTQPGRGGYISGPFRADFVPYVDQIQCPAGSVPCGAYCARDRRTRDFYVTCQPPRTAEGEWRRPERVAYWDMCPIGYSCWPHDEDDPAAPVVEGTFLAKTTQRHHWSPLTGAPMPRIDCVPWASVPPYPPYRESGKRKDRDGEGGASSAAGGSATADHGGATSMAAQADLRDPDTITDRSWQFGFVPVEGPPTAGSAATTL